MPYTPTTQQEITMNELLKLAEVGKAAQALATAAKVCNVSIDTLLPMVTTIAEKKLAQG